MLPITIKIHTASVNLNPASTIGWDSYAGVTVSCVKENFLYLINDGPLIQSGLNLKVLGALLLGLPKKVLCSLDA